MSTLTKVMRYEIVKPVDCEWKEFDKVLLDAQYDTWHVLNKTIQYCWEWAGFSSDYKVNNGDYPKAKDIFNLAGVSSYAYQKLSALYTRLNTGNLSTTIQKACKKWQSDTKDVFKGDKSIASYRRGCPIDVKNEGMKLFVSNDGYIIEMALISNSYKAEMERKSGRFQAAINPGRSSGRSILNRCISGEYKICSSQLLHKDHKWFFNLSYSFETKAQMLDENNIMGIDLGIVHPFYIVVGKTGYRTCIDGGEIEQFRKVVEARKQSLQRQGKWCGDGRIGHGTKTRLKPVTDIKDKIARFKDNVNHKYSRYLIELAKRHNCGVIQMEDLTGISENNKDKKFLKNWSYLDLQTKLTYKAAEVGIKVIKVNAQYTTQRCFKCGHIHEDNVPAQEKYRNFKCIACGYMTDADHNAAQNLALMDIENLISSSKCEI